MVADGYKKTEIGVIPVEWDIVQLKEVVYQDRKITYGIVQPGKNIAPNGVPLIRGKDYSSGKVITDDLYYVSEEIDKPYKRSKVIENDLLMTIVGYIGQMAIVPKSLVGANITQTTARISVNKDLYSYQYIYQYFLSNSGYKRLKKFEKGSAQPGLNLADVQKVKIPLPPLKEQEKIADILSTADDKTDAIASQIEKAEALKKGLLQKLLSEGIGHSEFKDSELGKIPLSWEVVEFGKHLDVKSGFGFKAADYSQDGIPLVKIDNVSYGNIIWENTTYLPTNFTEKYQELVLSKDDILLALNRPITQNKLKMAMLKEKDAPSILYQRVGKILFDETYFYKFIYYMLYRYVYDFVVHHSVGTDQPFINITKIRKLLIPLPPLQEQKQIAEILSTADEKLEVLRAKKEKYETLKKGLLQKLLSGEIRTV